MYDKLKYMHTAKPMEGIIVDIAGGAITIDLKGRLGQLKIPNRMLIADNEIKVGQEVGFMMSYIEVINETPNETYLQDIENGKEI